MVAVVKLPDLMYGLMMFEKILSIRILEWLVILIGCKSKVINELAASEPENSLVGLCSL